MLSSFGFVLDNSINMTEKYVSHPPVWKDGKSYEIYKKEMQLWEFSCEGILDAKKRAPKVLMGLPDNDSLGIKTKLLESLSMDEIMSDDGMKKVNECLDKLLGKDELDDMLSKMEAFDNYYKLPDESVNTYIMNFDQKYGRIKKEFKLPDKYLAFRLLGRAKLTNEERVLVIAPLDYKSVTLLDEMKASLKKVLGGGCSGGAYNGNLFGSESSGSAPAIKVEPTFYTQGRGNRGFRGNTRGYGRGFGGYPDRGGNRRENYGGRGSPHTNFSGGRGSPHTNFSGGRGSPHTNFSSGNRQAQGNMNSLLPDGSRMKCFRCGSVNHLIAQCRYVKDVHQTTTETGFEGGNGEFDNGDYRYSTEQTEGSPGSEHEVFFNEIKEWYSIDKLINAKTAKDASNLLDEEETVVLFTGNLLIENCLLSREASNSAVLDSACTSNVCGASWIKSYMSCLTEEQKKTVQRKPSSRWFRFGGESLYQSTGAWVFPATIAGKDIFIQADVVNSDVPLLLSLVSLKKLGALINYANDTAVLLGKTVNLSITSSGHHCVQILPKSIENVCAAVVLQELDGHTLLKKLNHIHRQFGHPTRERFITLLKEAGSWEKRFEQAIDQIYSQCDICKVYARTPSKPVVALPMAREFNEVVAMDLKYWRKGLWILHLVDMFSRYTMSEIILRKKPEEVIHAIMVCWIGVFGVMKAVLSDNGGEFSSDETRDVASVLNWRLCTTGAESPFQNGLCERNHAVCDSILTKLQAQYPKTPLSVLLKWANMAKNSLAMWNGFSSNQLVFGKNPNLPNILGDKLPALEGVTESKALEMHLNALHGARQEFIKTETDERIRRALKHKVRTSEVSYQKGDQVYYKKEDSERWMGPASVIGQDGKVVFVRHGGQLVRCSPNRLLYKEYVSSQLPIISDQLHKDNVSNEDFAVQLPQGTVQSLSGGEEQSVSDGNQARLTDNETVVPANSQIESQLEDDIVQNNDPVVQNNDPVVQNNDPVVQNKEPVRRSIRQFNKDTGFSIYMVTIPRSQHKSAECMAAKSTELNKLTMFDVYEVVPDLGYKAISTRWILWKKGAETRARLVARGFEEDVDADIDSPTIGKGMVRIVLTLAASKKWVVKTTDIKSAFLQGMPITRDVYLTPPPEADVEPDSVWKLKKCLYGLSDAARRFYDSVVVELISLGCQKSSFDPSFFFLKDSQGKLVGVIAAHIDDFLHAGTQEFEVAVIAKLCKRFLAGKHKENQFNYVGFQITQYSSGVLMDQNEYAENIDIKKMSAERETHKDDLLTTRELTDFRAMIGSLNWLVQGTRPDLAFAMTELSTKFRNARISDYVAAKKLLLKAKSSKCEIFFPDLGEPESWTMAVSADASYGNLNAGVDSCMGYLVFMVNNNLSCPIAWRSGKVKRVVRSTIAAEALALVEGIEEGIYMQNTMSILLNSRVSIIGFTDHLGLSEAIRSTKLADDRRLRLDIAAVKEMLVGGVLKEVRYCSTHDQLADSLTKKNADNKKLLTCLQTGIFNLEC